MIHDEKILTLANLCRIQADRFSNAKALTFERSSLTYSQLDRQSNRVANALLAQEIQPQSRVAILAKDSLKSYEILFACAKINVVLVPINWRLVASEVSYILQDANVEILFIGPDFQDLVQSIRHALDNVKTFIFLETITAEHFPLEKPEQSCLVYDTWFQQFDDTFPTVGVNQNNVAVQLYTSGTTGRPKGVQLAHYSFFAIAQEFAKRGQTWINWSNQDKNLSVVPFFHIGGLWWVIRGLVAGAENFIMEVFNPLEVLETIENNRITKTAMVPAMIQVVLAESQDSSTDFSSLEYIVYGGSPIAESLLKKAIATFGCNFVQIYGMTETGNCAVCLPEEAHTDGHLNRLKAAGKPFPGVSLSILDHEGQNLAPFQIGEICIKSPANMVGYWKLPEATAQTLVNGWVHTGDAGYLDEEGYVYICDRVKDMICCAGENIYPAEIENVLYEYPAIAEAAIIGIPDEDFGEAIKAIVVLKPNMPATAFDIINFVRGKIADFKLPRSVEFVESLPRTPSGKVQKGKLREHYWQGYQRRVN